MHKTRREELNFILPISAMDDRTKDMMDTSSPAAAFWDTCERGDIGAVCSFLADEGNDPNTADGLLESVPLLQRRSR